MCMCFIIANVYSIKMLNLPCYIVCSFVTAVEDVTVDTSSQPPVRSDISKDAKLAKLVEMGFQVEEGREALRQSHGDLEMACELLGKTPPESGLFSSLIGWVCCCETGVQTQVHNHRKRVVSVPVENITQIFTKSSHYTPFASLLALAFELVGSLCRMAPTRPLIWLAHNS